MAHQHTRYQNYLTPNRRALESYIKASINPTTPEEWEIALKNPESPIFKLFWSLVSEQMACTKMVCILAERQSKIANEEKQKEKEQMLKDEISRDKWLAARFEKEERKVEKYIVNQLEDHSLNHLKQLAVILPLQIEKWEKKSDRLAASIENFTKEMDTLQNRIAERQAVMVEQYVKQLKEQPTQFVSGKGEPIHLSTESIQSIQENMNRIDEKASHFFIINPAYRKYLHELPPDDAQKIEANRKNLMAIFKVAQSVNKTGENDADAAEPSFFVKNMAPLKMVPQFKVPRAKDEKSDENYENLAQTLALDKEKLKAEEEQEKIKKKLLMASTLFHHVSEMLDAREVPGSELGWRLKE